jgi:metallo-beta-lactamase class B
MTLALRTTLCLIFCLTTVTSAQAPRTLTPDTPNPCDDCAGWNEAQAPFKVFGNTYYVGTAGLSALLVTSDAGHILLDAALPQSAPLIDRNIRALGFKTEDIKVITNSHAHFDHAGGINALQRYTGATVAASKAGARALEAGLPTPDDPQIAFGPKFHAFPPVRNIRVVADGETVTVGPLAVTARYTPGHTPGATTWTWRSCEGSRCLDIVYADSLSAVAAPGFRFTGDHKTPSIVDSFRKSIDTLEKLPCDILFALHPAFSGMAEKLKQQAADPKSNPFIDASACRVFAGTARKRLEARIAEEKK